MARTMDAPGYRYAMVPHPLSNLTREECWARARDVLPDVLAILGLTDGEQRPAGTARTPAAAEPEDPRDQVSVADLTGDRVRDIQRLVEYCYQEGWTDGLPVVPVDEDTVRAFL